MVQHLLNRLIPKAAEVVMSVWRCELCDRDAV